MAGYSYLLRPRRIHPKARRQEQQASAIIRCGGFTDRKSAQAALDTGLVDLIGFGRPYIGNPDLAGRLQHGWPLHEADRSTYYTRRGELGYTDFPRYQATKAATAKCAPA